MLDVLLFSRVIPFEIKEIVNSKRKGTMSESGESLQWKIIEGLSDNIDGQVRTANYMPIQSWPKSYSDIYVRGGDFNYLGKVKIKNLPFLNICILKRLLMGHPLYKEIKKWSKNSLNEEKVIISYSLTPEFLKAVKIAKKYNKNLKAIAIVADLPEFTILEKKKSFLTKLYLSWMKKQTYNKLDYIDGYVLLTKYMAEKLVSNNQKYIVMEGIASEIKKINQVNAPDRFVLYAGTLHKKFGIVQLLNAFKYVKDPNLKLILFGIGDSIDIISKFAKFDSRIDYRGQLSREEVLSLMTKAMIIVNPRFEKEEYTKYSFPSKNLEALSSGVPFVAFKLKGIPDEYDSYINYPRNDSPESLGETINSICDNYDYFLNKAKEGKVWVQSNKNKRVQTKRIADLIKDILNG